MQNSGSHLLHADYVGERYTSLGRGNAESSSDGKHGDNECQENAEEIKPDTEPSLFEQCMNIQIWRQD